VLTVRTIFLHLSAASVTSLFFFGMLASAQVRSPQTQAMPPASVNVSRYQMAVVDIGYIFKHHGRFMAQMQSMKKDVEAAETVLKQERQAIGKMQERLEGLKPGTPDYKQLDEQIAKSKADFNLKASQQRKEFLDREGKIYYNTYLEVSDAVKYYAQRHDIGLVVRFNGNPTDPNQRKDIMEAINRPVVYQNAIDITPNILAEMNRSMVQREPSQGGRRATRPPIPGQPQQR
jgi:Skp family chaperone for outer membrane proteins